ncbi:MAG: hypothetical protein JRI25_27595 [Deltaproteobacteria bacterium]|nr:hypothetical protein [Deltaproteobacteria bacterium]
MKQLDWNALEPYRPLPGQDSRYVRRPWGGGDRLAMLVRHGLTPIAVTGPVGSGKTTELHQALQLLRDEVIAIKIPVELLVDLDALQPNLLVYLVAQFVLDKVLEDDPGLVPSRALVADIRASDPRLPRGGGLHHNPPELAELVIAEVKRLLGRDRLALFLDGLDRVSAEGARAAVRVVVVPPALANGPEAHEVLAHMRVFWVPTVPVGSDEGRRYLGKVAAVRLGLKRLVGGMRDLCDKAAEESGGVTRLFLHLVQDAAFYAIAEGRARPGLATLDRAVRDHTDALRRVLVAGDLEALRDADGTDGLDVPVECKVRLLAHNLLLEYEDAEGTVVRPHPLVRRLIARRATP